ncbi:hypothetical protein M7M4_08280 [Corynebacterium pseudogenitalium]
MVSGASDWDVDALVLVELGVEELVAGALLLAEVGAVDVGCPTSSPSLEHAARARGMMARVENRRFMLLAYRREIAKF